MENFLDGTLNLPKLEEEILKFWKKNRIFEKSLQKTRKGKLFTFYDGPPFATGLPHYGHILASTIKDVIPRYQTMKGRFVRRRWGWDCHGLPVEEIVERQLGISGKKQIEKIGVAKFNETCRSTVLQYVREWKKMIERIARWVEFDDSYKTMDNDYMESVWWAFKQIYEKGLVYEGRKVLMYCPRCETPVSNFEVAMDNSYQEVNEEAVTVKFRVKPGQKIGNWKVPENTFILAWTTTPWTLPGNVALAVGKDIEYVIVKKFLKHEKNKATYQNLILAKSIYEKASSEKPEHPFNLEFGQYFSSTPDGAENVEFPKVIVTMNGEKFVGLKYEPLFEVPALKSPKTFKIYPADFVTTEEGTGIVHTAAVYGEEDYNLGIKEGLPIVPLLDEKGVFNDKAPKLIRGKYFKDADKIIIADLEKRGLLFVPPQKHTHSYPFCWRCGNALFYNAIPAWFINIQKIKKALLKSNDKEINWFPEHLKHGRYEKSIEQAPDWNISRNRYWGNPIPVWKCEKCGRKEAVGSLVELGSRSGSPKNNYWMMRHGEAQSNVRHLIDSGQKKIKLTAIGRDQVLRAAEKLKKDLARQGKKIDVIISSPILRAKESSEIDEKIFGLKKVIFDERIEEINLGPNLAGCHGDKYHQLFPTYESKFENRPENGESLRDLRARAWDFFQETEKKYKGKNILLVSHEYPIWMLEHVAEGWDEMRSILEKKKRKKRGVDFIKTGEVRKLDFKILPRNNSGELDLHRPYIDSITLSCAKCGGQAKRITEIFDSWIEASSMPFAEYHYPFENKKIFESRFPAQFVAEYIAQTRAWFYTMHVISLILFKEAPFENVVTTGTILAEDGSKMSKSKGNFPDPWDVVNKYGADSLRFYLMNSVVMHADNLNFNVRDLENIYRKVWLLLWNIYRYFKIYADARGQSGSTANISSKSVLDKWIDGRTQELVAGVTKSLDSYDTVQATRLIQEYVDDLSTWYLRRSRGRNDKAFFLTLQNNLLITGKVIAPFMPYLAETIYLGLKQYPNPTKQNNSASVHLADWPKYSKRQIANSKSLLDGMNEIRRLASLALAKRAEARIKVRQPLASLKIKNQKSKIKINELLNILKNEVNVKQIVFDKSIKDEVELDTRITIELRQEGLVRELRRIIQNLRQEAGLKPQDKIALFLKLPEEIYKAVVKNEKLLKSGVNAKNIEYRKSTKFIAETETKIDDSKIWVALNRIH